MQFRPRFLILCATLAFWLTGGYPAMASALSADDAWERWRPAAEVITLKVDNTPWSALLQTYLDSSHPSGINRFAYDAVTVADRQRLGSYIDSL